MSADGADIIGHVIQWLLLFVGILIVPSLSHGDSCGLSIQCSKDCCPTATRFARVGTLLTQ